MLSETSTITSNIDKNNLKHNLIKFTMCLFLSIPNIAGITVAPSYVNYQCPNINSTDTNIKYNTSYLVLWLLITSINCLLFNWYYIIGSILQNKYSMEKLHNDYYYLWRFIDILSIIHILTLIFSSIYAFTILVTNNPCLIICSIKNVDCQLNISSWTNLEITAVFSLCNIFYTVMIVVITKAT